MKKALIALAVVAFVVAGAAQPAFAQQQDDPNETEEPETPENETEEEDSEDEEIEGTDNSTELLIEQGEAEQTARGALSDNNWTLEDSEVEEEDGYYEFEFVIQGEDAEAEVAVDGSSGEVFRSEEELEESNETEEEEVNETEEEENETERAEGRSAQFDARLGVAINTVSALVEIAPNEEAETGLQDALDQLREVQNQTDTASLGPERPDEAADESEEEESENESSEEGGQQGPPEDRGPSQNSNRPGFVNRMLSGIFG